MELLRNHNVTISEAAFRYNNLFVRVDIIVKNGNEIHLKEVKAKSFSLNNEDSFFNQDGTICSDWQEYLYDIAFQFYVVSKAYPQFKISSFLTLSNKDATCPTDGLNQKFRITRDSTNRKGIRVSSSLNDEDLKHPLVIDVPVDEVIDQIFQNWGTNEPKPRSFIEEIEYLSNLYKNDQKAVPVLGSWCKKCEFKCSDEDESKGKKSGFKECWNQILNWSEKDFQEASVLDLWASRRKDQYIEEGIFKLKELDIEDVEPKPDKKPGLSSSQRQWLQVEKTKNQDNSVFVDKDGLRSEFSKWTYPLHIIDFETATVPIGFVKGQAPYSTIVFQFSHHTIDKDWNVKHAGEFLAVEPGRFPNFDFVRELKRQLEKDNGTIFMYSAHENSCLNAVYRQLKISQEPDKDDLCDFIQSITYSSWVDLCLEETDAFTSIKLTVHVSVNDFTRGAKHEHLLHTEKILTSKLTEDRTNVYAEIFDLVLKTKKGLLKDVVPLAPIVPICGGQIQKRYHILHSISDYILSHNLLLQNGCIRIDKTLGPIFGKGVSFVNEGYFFDTLKSNYRFVEPHLDGF